MEEEMIDRQILTEYLLGKLPEAKHQAVAERYFADESLFDDLLEVENDLIDQYVRGQLNANDRRDLEGYLQLLPDGKHKVGVAAALMSSIEAQVPAETTEKPGARWRSLFAAPRTFALQYALVAGAIVLSIGVILLGISGLRLRRQSEALRAQIAQLTTEQKMQQQKSEELERVVNNQNNRVGQLQKELEKAQQRSETYAQEISKLRDSALAMVSLELTPASRSFSTPDTVVVAPRTKYVSLIVPIGGHEKYTGYRAILQTVAGKLIWEGQRRLVGPRGLGNSIALRLATGPLTVGTYKLTLILAPETGSEIPLDYYFTVVKR